MTPSTRKQHDDRRDSPRVKMSFLIRETDGRGEWEEHTGDLALGGIHWRGKNPPRDTEVEVRFRLPGVPREIRCRGEIIRLKAQGQGIDFHVRFTELEVENELAMARFLDEWLASH